MTQLRMVICGSLISFEIDPLQLMLWTDLRFYTGVIHDMGSQEVYKCIIVYALGQDNHLVFGPLLLTDSDYYMWFKVDIRCGLVQYQVYTVIVKS